MLDKSIPYSNIIMICSASSVAEAKVMELPQGYTYQMYKSGDGAKWAEIEYSVGEFPTLEAAQEYFDKNYLPYEDRMMKRSCYIADETGEYVATASALWYDDESGTHPTLGWVAVKPGHQGRKLGRAIVAKALSVHAELDAGENIVLHTQTWSHKAVRMYYSFGFRMSQNFEFFRFKNDFEKSLEILKLRMREDEVKALEENSVE